MRIINRSGSAWTLKAIVVLNIFLFCFQHAAAEESVCQLFSASGTASEEVRQIVDEIVTTGDNKNMPFVILDKKQAKIYSFQKDGQLLAEAPALLGIAIGDKYIPGTGQKKLSEIRIEERTTPAGRFHGRLGYDSHGEEVLWVDFDMAIAIHPVVTSNPKEHRLERLESPKPQDHRISFGCINVPRRYYITHISPLFKGTGGIVYVLPENSPVNQLLQTSKFSESTNS